MPSQSSRPLSRIEQQVSVHICRERSDEHEMLQTRTLRHLHCRPHFWLQSARRYSRRACNRGHWTTSYRCNDRAQNPHNGLSPMVFVIAEGASSTASNVLWTTTITTCILMSTVVPACLGSGNDNEMHWIATKSVKKRDSQAVVKVVI